jgi:hypothetical protein
MPSGGLGVNVIRGQHQPAGFMDLNQQRGFNTGADTSGEHAANVDLARANVGDVGGGDFGQGTSPSYGFSPEDYNNIYRYMVDPLNSGNVSNYMGIVNRLKGVAGSNSQFSQWGQPARDTWATNMPLYLTSAYGLMPAPILQNWNIPQSNIPNMRF